MILFDRNCEVTINDQFFSTFTDYETGAGLTIEWDYDIKKYDEPAKLKVEIYNPAQEVVSNLKQLDPVTFSFGYLGETEMFFSGFLDKFDYDSKGIDKVLKITAIEQDALIFKQFSVSYEAGTSGKYIIQDIAKRSGLTIKQLDIALDREYSTGYCVYGKPINELRDVVKDCGSMLKIEGKELYIYIDNVNKNEVVLLDYTSGLLEEPQIAVKSTVGKSAKEGAETLYTHKLKAMAIPMIKKNSIVVIEGDELQLTGQVIEMKIDNYEAEYFVRRMDK
ncbi:MAG: hypothetical protein ACRC5T_06480 [Cetobacterium sp.]